jgi:hypothetical protein
MDVKYLFSFYFLLYDKDFLNITTILITHFHPYANSLQEIAWFRREAVPIAFVRAPYFKMCAHHKFIC